MGRLRVRGRRLSPAGVRPIDRPGGDPLPDRPPFRVGPAARPGVDGHPPHQVWPEGGRSVLGAPGGGAPWGWLSASPSPSGPARGGGRGAALAPGGMGVRSGRPWAPLRGGWVGRARLASLARSGWRCGPPASLGPPATGGCPPGRDGGPAGGGWDRGVSPGRSVQGRAAAWRTPRPQPPQHRSASAGGAAPPFASGPGETARSRPRRCPRGPDPTTDGPAAGARPGRPGLDAPDDVK